MCFEKFCKSDGALKSFFFCVELNVLFMMGIFCDFNMEGIHGCFLMAFFMLSYRSVLTNGFRVL